MSPRCASALVWPFASELPGAGGSGSSTSSGAVVLAAGAKEVEARREVGVVTVLVALPVPIFDCRLARNALRRVEADVTVMGAFAFELVEGLLTLSWSELTQLSVCERGRSAGLKFEQLFPLLPIPCATQEPGPFLSDAVVNARRN